MVSSASDAARPAATPPDTGPFRWIVLAGVWLIYATFGMAVVSLAPLVPQVMRDLSIGATGMGLVFGSWQLVYIFAAIPCGALLDRMGVRYGLLLGAAIMALSCLLRAYATDLVTMTLAVGLFGIGGPIVSTGAPKVVAQWFKGRERGLAMGIYITGPALGAMLALSTTHTVLIPVFGDWRGVMWVWAAASLVAGAIWFALAQTAAMRASDVTSAAGPQQGQLAVVMELLRLPSVRILLLMSIGIFAFNHGLNNWLPEILRDKGMSAAAAGYWASVPTLIGLVGSLTIPRLATPARRYLILIGLCVAAVIATLLLRADPGGVLAIGLVAQGIARSSLMTIAILALVETPEIGERRAGVASGMFFAAAEVGGAGGPLALGALYAGSAGFESGFTFLTIVTVLLTFGGVYLARLAGKQPG
ncbi:MAG: MFS transporter [Hyphomicrobiaceae bacterium]|nr:MFS transporter [Hyphomicrobiaceae bacterium]